MERTTSIKRAREIMRANFLGLEELSTIKEEMGICFSNNLKKPIIPPIYFSEELLEKSKNEYILILGIPFYKDGTPLTIIKMREHFGWDPDKSEPCFYNQDWYLKEKFAYEKTLESKWYMLKKDVYEEYRCLIPREVENSTDIKIIFPEAILCAFTFFCYFFNSGGEILWKKDFVWCSDKDSNNDQIYVGGYNNPKSLNKNGFNIHRHLSIKNNFSYISKIEQQK